MSEFQFSEHALDMLKVRNIRESWVELALTQPDMKKLIDDESIHYVKAIEDYGKRNLRVIVNPKCVPPKIITVFFDRRIKELP